MKKLLGIILLLGMGCALTNTVSPQEEVGSVAVSINVDLMNPPEITFTGSEEILLSGSSLTIKADVSEEVDSYVWYLNGVIIPGETADEITLGEILSVGYHNLTLIVSVGEVLASESLYFLVVQP